MYPWLDRSGRFSPFKALTLLLLVLPAALVAADYLQGALEPRPLTQGIHQVGLWAIRLLFISLALTPLRQALQLPKLITVRRMVGVAAFAYVALHLVLYAADQMYDLEKVASEIVLRIYLTIGFVAFLGLAALAATSTDGMVRRLGGKRWRRLHQMAYVVGLLGSIHFFMQTKADITEPLAMAGIYAWLMGYRLVAAFVPGAGAVPVRYMATLGILATLGTALAEAGYFWWTRGVDPMLLLAADVNWNTGTRPAWLVLGVILPLFLAIGLRRIQHRQVLRRPLAMAAGGL